MVGLQTKVGLVPGATPSAAQRASRRKIHRPHGAAQSASRIHWRLCIAAGVCTRGAAMAHDIPGAVSFCATRCGRTTTPPSKAEHCATCITASAPAPSCSRSAKASAARSRASSGERRPRSPQRHVLSHRTPAALRTPSAESGSGCFFGPGAPGAATSARHGRGGGAALRRRRGSSNPAAHAATSEGLLGAGAHCTPRR